MLVTEHGSRRAPFQVVGGIAGGCSDFPPQGSRPGGPLECSRWPVDPWPGEQPGLSPEGLRRHFPSLPHILYCILLTMAGLASFLLLETSSIARYHPRHVEDGEQDPEGKRRASSGDKIMGQWLHGGHRESPEELESPWTRESCPPSQDRLWGSSSPLGCGSWSALGELQSLTQDHRGGTQVICASWGLPVPGLAQSLGAQAACPQLQAQLLGSLVCLLCSPFQKQEAAPSKRRELSSQPGFVLLLGPHEIWIQASPLLETLSRGGISPPPPIPCPKDWPSGENLTSIKPLLLAACARML